MFPTDWCGRCVYRVNSWLLYFRSQRWTIVAFTENSTSKLLIVRVIPIESGLRNTEYRHPLSPGQLVAQTIDRKGVGKGRWRDIKAERREAVSFDQFPDSLSCSLVLYTNCKIHHLAASLLADIATYAMETFGLQSLSIILACTTVTAFSLIVCFMRQGSA